MTVNVRVGSSWVPVGSSTATGKTKVARIYDSKSQNTTGGTPSGTGFENRTLNAKDDPYSFVTLESGNVAFSLAAGAYRINWRAPAHDGGAMRTKLEYANNSSFTSSSEVLGETGYSDTASAESNYYSCGNAILTTTEKIYFRIQQAQALGNWGQASNLGGPEIYTQVFVEDLATAIKESNVVNTAKTKVATVKDVKAYNVDGGAASTNTWITRDLNTISDPNNIGLSVSANVITVPAGTYSIRWSAPAWRVQMFTSKVEYSTNSTFATGVTSVQGSNSFASNSSSDGTQSQTVTIGTLASVTFSTTTYVRIRQWNAQAKDPAEGDTDNALGVATNVSGAGDSVYTTVVIEDLATAVKESNIVNTGKTKVALLKDEKDEGVQGGSFTQGGWKDRNLTVEEDPQGFVSFTAGGPTSSIGTQNEPGYWSLAAGTYLIEWSAPAHNVTKHQSLLVYSTTSSHISTAGLDASASYVEGSSEDITAGGSGGDQSISVGSKVITTTGTTWFKIMHRCEVDAFGEGMGQDTPGWGTKEIYTQVRIQDLATAVKETGDDYVSGINKVAVLEDQKTSGTAGGNFDTGAWRDRTLNAKDDSESLINLDSGNVYFSLVAGTYRIGWSAPATAVDQHQTRLIYATDTGFSSNVGYVYGSSEQSDQNEGDGGASTIVNESRSFGTTVLTIGATTYFKIQHRSSISSSGSNGNTQNWGMGVPSGFSGDSQHEVYTQVIVEDLATAVLSGDVVGDKIQEGNTSVETVDTGSDGHVKITTEGTERFRVTSDGDTTTMGRQYLSRRNSTAADKSSLRQTFYSEVANGASQAFQLEGTPYGGGLVTVTSMRDANATFMTTQVYLIGLRGTNNSSIDTAFTAQDGESGQQSHTVAGTSKGVTVTNNSGHTSDIFVTFDVQGFIP